MGCFAIMRGSRAIINDTPIVDGQFFMETDQLDLADLTKYNKIYIDNNNQRTDLTTYKWSALMKPFETINQNNLNVDLNGKLSAKNQSWGMLVNKPFLTVGQSLIVQNSILSANVTWDKITNKPFNTIGVGLIVDSDNKLKANVASVDVININIEDIDGFVEGYQSFMINDINNQINNTLYMEYQQILSTTDNTMYSFDSPKITKNSMIEIYTSIWGVNPIKMDVDNGNCSIIFPKYDTDNVNMTCRIYVL